MKRVLLFVLLFAILIGFQPVFGVTGTKKADHKVCSLGSFPAGKKISITFQAGDMNGRAVALNYTVFSADANYLPSGMVFGATTLINASQVSFSPCLADPNDPASFSDASDIIVQAILTWTPSLFERSHREIPICAKDNSNNETWMWVAFDVVEPNDTQSPTIFGCSASKQ